MTKITGGCICGSVRYELMDEPLFTHVCHCTECQHDSGGAFHITSLILAKDLKFTAKAPNTSYITRESGNEYKLFGCETCCCKVAGVNTSQTAIMVVRPGTFDDTSGIQPQAHIWIKEKQSWFIIPDSVSSFEEEYDYTQVWPKTSLARGSVRNSVSIH